MVDFLAHAVHLVFEHRGTDVSEELALEHLMRHLPSLLGFEGLQQLLDLGLLDGGGSSVLLVVLLLAAVLLFKVVLLLAQVCFGPLG